MSSNIKIAKKCPLCEETFIARKISTQYCSHKCSQRAYKMKKNHDQYTTDYVLIANPQKANQKKSQKKSPENKLSIQTLHILQCREFLSVLEVSHMFGVCRATIHNYCVKGLLKCIKMNRKIYIRRKDIEALFDLAPPYKVVPKPKHKNQSSSKEETASYVHSENEIGFYSAQEAADKYGYSKSGIHKLAARKKIPKTMYEGIYLYNKVHIDKELSKTRLDESITEWYSVNDIKQQYAMSTSAVYSFVSEYGIPRKNDRGKTLYSQVHVDLHLQPRMGDPSIETWYSMEDINNRYGLTPGFIANFVFKHHIPRKRSGNKSFYSKIHFDDVIKRKQPRNEYISVNDAVETYGLSRASLYGIIGSSAKVRVILTKYSRHTIHEKCIFAG